LRATINMIWSTRRRAIASSKPIRAASSPVFAPT